jgi:hypothetical protein
MHTGAL